MWVSKRKIKEIEQKLNELERNSVAYCFELNKSVSFQDYVRFVPKLIKEAIARNNSPGDHKFSR